MEGAVGKGRCGEGGLWKAYATMSSACLRRRSERSESRSRSPSKASMSLKAEETVGQSSKPWLSTAAHLWGKECGREGQLWKGLWKGPWKGLWKGLCGKGCVEGAVERAVWKRLWKGLWKPWVSTAAHRRSTDLTCVRKV